MEHMTIEWKEINPDYIVSNDGQVISKRFGRSRVLKPRRNKLGYAHVWISTDAGPRTCKIHRLVAEAFIGPPPTTAHEVNHKNGIRDDNRSDNLEWVTHRQNAQHRFSVLKHGNARGESNGKAKLTITKVREIRARVAAGELQNLVAADCGITATGVWSIVNGNTWAWLDAEVKA